ncbi:MAG TPA: universal stress protein [Pyrinomonadaceae bacterium]|jgi:nucleotide-binding universal stress UspA family protein
MNRRMRAMFAYDGSPSANGAIKDLRRAGLPPRGEALIALVADISKTAIAGPRELGVLGKYVSARLLKETIALTARETARAVNDAKMLALAGGERIRAMLPGWRVGVRTAIGDPAEELLRTARNWKPDLIIAGSHGRGAVRRFFLGSVSKKLAEKALSPVRIERGGFAKTGDAPVKIIIGAKTLPDAEKLIGAVGERVWLEETKIRLVKVDDGNSAGRISAVYPYAGAILDQAVEDLRAGGLRVSTRLESGDLKSALLDEAANWEADSVFVTAGEGIEGGLSETAAGLVTAAPCAVEVVR